VPRPQRSHTTNTVVPHAMVARITVAHLYGCAVKLMAPRGRGNELEHRCVGWGHGSARLGP
jgi:hypothetical protein